MRLARIAAFALLVVVTWYVLAVQAFAHDWFTKYRDPVFGWGCCGGNDCKPFVVNKRNITAEADGFHVRLTLEEAQAINPDALFPIDGVVTYDRVLPSETDEWAICLKRRDRSPENAGVFCLFQPPNI